MICVRLIGRWVKTYWSFTNLLVVNSQIIPPINLANLTVTVTGIMSCKGNIYIW